MGWTDPKTWTNGEQLTASDLNVYLRDNLDYLYDGIAVRSYAATASVSASTWTTVSYTSTDWDTSSFWASGTASRLTVPAGEGGYYRVSFHAAMGAHSTTSTVALRIRKNGSTTQNISKEFTNTSPLYVQGYHGYSLAAGDYLEGQVWHDDSGSVTFYELRLELVQINRTHP